MSSDIGKPCCAEIRGHTTTVLRSFDQTTRDQAGLRNCIGTKICEPGLGSCS